MAPPWGACHGAAHAPLAEAAPEHGVNRMQSNPSWLSSCWLVLCLVAGVASNARASVMEAMDLPDLVNHADRVVMGRVVEVRSDWDETGMRIRTRARVQVEETLVGDPAQEVVVERMGGVVGDLGQLVMGEADLGTHDHVLLFLEPVARGKRVFRTVGMAQGCMAVTTDALGELRVSRKSSSLTLRLRTPGSSGPSVGVMVPDQGMPSRPYVELRDLIQAMRRGRP